MLRPKRIVPRRIAPPDPASGNPLHEPKVMFLEWTLSIGLAEQTTNIRGAALDRFIRWCDVNAVTRPEALARERMVSADPARDLEMPKLPRRLPRWVPSVHQGEQVLAQPSTARISGIRDRANLEVLYSTAISAHGDCTSQGIRR
jgi:integrase/recombinase XerD